MFIQGIENVYELDWEGVPGEQGGKRHGEIFYLAEAEFSDSDSNHSDK